MGKETASGSDYCLFFDILGYKVHMLMTTNNDCKAVCFGEILWDILPDAQLPGGAPMNVAYHLNQLGVPATMISRTGKDELGRKLLDFISSKNVPIQFIQEDEQYDTGTVLATVSENHVSYDIIQPVAWDYIEYSIALQRLVSATPYFIFGSLVARNETSRQTLFELLESATHKVLDINLRKPHYEKSTLDYLLQHADILKLNEDELEILSGWYGFSGTDEDRIKSFRDRFHLHTVITTRGDKGAIVWQDGVFCKHKGYKVKVADTIGSGDAFLAGFLSKTINGAGLEEATAFACGMGAFIATHHGACPVYTKAGAEKAMSAFT